MFRAINRWGQVKASALHPNSVIPILRQALQGAGVDVQGISSHSLRRGFATWATRNGWDQKALMDYVGWRDAKSALRYVESTGIFPGQLQPYSPSLAVEEPPALPSPGAPPGS
ncbi:Phage integrase family protein [compost metagenome]